MLVPISGIAAREGAASSGSDSIFLARRLVKRFGAQVALDGLDLSVGRGEVVCLLGANDPTRKPSAARRRVAYIPEQVSLFPMLTGIENLDYLVRLAGERPARADLLRWFEQAGLDPRRGRPPRGPLFERNAPEGRHRGRPCQGGARDLALEPLKVRDVDS
jgi:hypothetical protein